MTLNWTSLTEQTRRTWDRVLSGYAAPRESPRFRDVTTYCMFVGQARSGTTLCGALLTAHPQVSIAHELDALAHVESGITRERLFWLLQRRDRQFVAQGCRALEYSYRVPNQWQGRYERLTVIGDKRAAASSDRLARRPDLLRDLEAVVQMPVRVVHMVRNPFDTIATMARRRREPLSKAIDLYSSRAEASRRVIAHRDPAGVLTVRHETFLADPKAGLATVVRFLGLEPEDRYLGDCASIVVQTPATSRRTAAWTPSLVAAVQARIDDDPALRGYAFGE